jgi:hypothetical protein
MDGGGWVVVVDSRHQPTCIIAPNEGPSFLQKERVIKKKVLLFLLVPFIFWTCKSTSSTGSSKKENICHKTNSTSALST